MSSSFLIGGPARHLLRLALLLWMALAPCYGATNYTVSLANPEQHLVEVQVILPEGSARRELQLPVWNALYQVRDFAQYVNWVRAKDRAGRPLAVFKLDKSRWQITGAEGGAVVDYQIFVDSPGPFGAQLNSHHAFFNLAQLLMYPEDARSAPMAVRFKQIPQGWHVATPLAGMPNDAFSAENYDRLVDSPVEIGEFKESDFDEGGAHYRVIVEADPGDFDMEKVIAMLHKITAAATGWMDDRPFDGYMFLYHFPRGPAGGGMEHAYSTAIALNADVPSRAPEVLASVTAHEFFHLWNVKRIRPQTLEPVDYTRENYTRALWFSEGCTSTAADIIQLRAGLLDEARSRAGPGVRHRRTRAPSRRTSRSRRRNRAWMRGWRATAYYRSPERSISYYNKGELLGIMLDFVVREASHGQASLREVFSG